MKPDKTYKRVLTIAGSDSGGGAGIQADLKTFSALGCFGMSVITSLTAQNTQGVTGIHAVPPEFVRQQMDAVLSDIGTDAVKIGMLFSPELIRAVADGLVDHRVTNIVLDPVMVAQSGDRLLQGDAIDAIREHLLSLADVLTPNLPEAEVLAGTAIRSKEQIEQAAQSLSMSGSGAVLIKGGHLTGERSDDLLYLAEEGRFVEISGQRLETCNNHGTGCTLSSAIASMLASGYSVERSVRLAKDYIQVAISAGAGYRIGHGHGPVHHFFNYWE